MQTNDTVTLMY